MERIPSFPFPLILLDRKKKKSRLPIIPLTAANKDIFLQILAFVGLWIFLKIQREAKWSLVDLSRPEQVVRIFRHLHDIRLSATQS